MIFTIKVCDKRMSTHAHLRDFFLQESFKKTHMKMNVWIDVTEILVGHKGERTELSVEFRGVISSPALPREDETVLFPVQGWDHLECEVKGVEYKLEDGVLKPEVVVVSNNTINYSDNNGFTFAEHVKWRKDFFKSLLLTMKRIGLQAPGGLQEN